MRKGSTKNATLPNPPPLMNYEGNKTSPAELQPKAYKSEQIRIAEVLDILLRICDACHEIQNEQEPWASIRKDIERLR